MIIHDSFEQQSVQWFQVRAGKVTASDMHRLVSDAGKVRVGDGPKTLLLEKLAEKWIGGPLPQPQSFMMDQGNLLETLSRPAFTLETNMEIEQVGFIESDDHSTGCSPDGLLLNRTAGVELKAPGYVNHIRYLLDGVVPDEYKIQLQHSLFVTGFEFWWFCSFHRSMPSLILRVGRDEKIQAAIAEAVALFNEQLDAAWARLCEINGGPPPPRREYTLTPGKPQFSWEITP